MTSLKPSILLLKEKTKNSDDPYETQLAQNGFSCIYIPVLEHCLINLDELRTILSEKSQNYSGIIVTSKRAVDALSQVWSSLDDTIKQTWAQNPVYTVGPSTASLVRKLGLSPSGEDSGCALNLGQEIIHRFENRKADEIPRLLFLIGDKRRHELPNMMTNASIVLDELLVYATQLRTDLKDAIQKTVTMRLDWVVLFSPSGSKALDMVISQLGEASKPRIAAIGNTTSKHLKDRGYSVDAVADKPDATSLCKSVVKCMDKGFDSQARE